MSVSFLFVSFLKIHICHFLNNIPQAVILKISHMRKHVLYLTDTSDYVSVNVYIRICHWPPPVMTFSHSTCIYITFESMPS